ncbi:phenylalanine--tRNA ligase subunit beta [Carboxydochorda subterranea]|uniref:Phenylalanine--tRNA ligase beta subunit n=1 Tax=Carboxydichorda subterranea TaxID=3109565 RepID=A0ABZ1C1M6_9FIRM|nr:phenylalanine--tRNA ligase subunit beta [Limnochorda sp. L945t]WRP18706.1 phenylalanine--tRNA ligase subunit beta [Limnochorda sp. L945t]
MRLPLSWLRAYVEVPVDADELARRLQQAGIPVEGWYSRATGGPASELSGIRVGRIVAVEPHPSSRHLVVARVDVGDGVLQVVTGAPNARAGMLAPVAAAGTYVAPMKSRVEAVQMGGVVSQGVLLSAREAGIGEDTSGLLELPEGVRPGAPLAEALHLADDVLEIETYPNRPDWMSVVGLAREVAAVWDLPLDLPPVEYPEADPDAARACDVAVESYDDCPRYVARLVYDVPKGATPWWMVQRLYLAGMRSISPVVDVTNYVMLELGQPLHAFDLDRLAEHRIVVRRARPGETMVTLDGQERPLDPSMLVIADAAVPQALAGLMGGQASEVGPRTQAVLLESATFHPALIRRTSRRLGLRTEASARFERGLPVDLAEWGSRRACHLLRQMGARVARGSVDRRVEQGGTGRRTTVVLDPVRVNGLLGTSLGPDTMAKRLRALGMEVHPAAPGAGQLAVVVPAWRRDIQEEADLAEEVARLGGYDAIPTTLPRSTAPGRMPPEVAWAWEVRRVLAAAGLYEVLTYSFMDPAELSALRLPAEHEWLQAVPVANPLAADQAYLRTTLVVGMLRAVRLNVARRQGDIRLFEVGRVFLPRSSGDGRDDGATAGIRAGTVPEAVRLQDRLLPQEPLRAAIALLAVPGLMERHWYGPPRAYDFFDLKGLLEAVAEALGVEVRWQAAERPGFHPGRTASLFAAAGEKEVELGFSGELDAQACVRLDIPGRLYLAELALDAMYSARRPVRVEPLPKFPGVQRDLALVVGKATPAAEVERLVAQYAGPWAEQVRVFDVYEGPGLPAGMKSVGISVSYRAPDRTLSDEEVDRARLELLDRLERHGIRLRV